MIKMDHYRTDSTNFKSYPIDLKKTAKFLCHFDKQTQVIFFCFSLKKKKLAYIFGRIYNIFKIKKMIDF